ncbi:MAG: BadF/BadG/BcrA/BcrD ATPase family protein [Candidatus Eisenbacteria bacterium]
MEVYLGIDLGSTTSKAVIIDGDERIIGRGITNTRSNYEVAADIARVEAEFNSRFSMLRRTTPDGGSAGGGWGRLLGDLENRFHFLQFEARFESLLRAMIEAAGEISDLGEREEAVDALTELAPAVLGKIRGRFFAGEVSTTSDFFRDLFSTTYMAAVHEKRKGLYDTLTSLYDRSVVPVENRAIDFDFRDLVHRAIDLLDGEDAARAAALRPRLDQVANLSLEPTDYIGTGYGRQLLPFEQKHIKSEILCHALGAHACFPETRTVLDIGGQDTKAIQVDGHGLVTSFQMNDRCAAGCGRYLGYIADEMNIGVGELGPLALKADYKANICSTCTVFAGAELREYLNLGEKKENILAGLHEAIVQRAFALLARSGGVRNEFTFTGGVARNPAVFQYVSESVLRNYGDITINRHADSIFMGALGAGLFSARRKH